VNSLQDVIDKINLSSHLSCHFEADDSAGMFDHGTQLSIYRIITELISNVIKHAGAGKLYLQLFMHENLYNVIVEDDGSGIETETHAPGIGLSNIRSRLDNLNGSMNIDSHNNKGTTIIIQIPAKQTSER
jgi:signal transduction histidine kinase